jgi:hypothetical protein
VSDVVAGGFVIVAIQSDHEVAETPRSVTRCKMCYAM